MLGWDTQVITGLRGWNSVLQVLDIDSIGFKDFVLIRKDINLL